MSPSLPSAKTLWSIWRQTAAGRPTESKVSNLQLIGFLGRTLAARAMRGNVTRAAKMPV
jgi:hypothetical protein